MAKRNHNFALANHIFTVVAAERREFAASPAKSTRAQFPMAKIAFIGAGSVVFTKNLISDILQNPALAGSTLCLMDIDPARLKVADILARRIVEQLQVPARVESTLSLQEACTGARYVITMIQVGGYKPATVTDFDIPRKYGLRQTIADTLGVGGVFRALRTMPELIKVGRMLRDHGAEQPLYLNYSNPMAMNMMAIDRACGVPSVGLCHSVQGTSRQLANYAGLPYQDISYKVAGINHMAFFLEFRYQGQDAYPLLFKALDNPQVFAEDKVRFEMMRRLGYFVTESSEHFSEYCPYFIHHGSQVIEEFGIPLDEYLRRCEAIIATWQDTEKQMLGDRKPVVIKKSVEYCSRILNAMETGLPDVIYGNVPNAHLITNLPEQCCVEVPCLVDHQGLQPTVIGALPPQLAALIRTNVNVQELAVQACLTGEREYIYHAVMMDPHASSQLTLSQIWAMCDELIDAHQRDGLLPQFKPVRKNTGRSLHSLERIVATFSHHTRNLADQTLTELSLDLENMSERDFQGPLRLLLDRSRFDCSLPETVQVTVAAGQTIHLPLTIRHESTAAADLRIEVRGESKFVLGVEYRAKKRLHVKAGAGEKAAPLHLQWADHRMAEGTLSLEEDFISLHLRVQDTSIQVKSEAFWDGSAIELFFSDASSQCGRPIQIIALPAPENPVVRSPDGTTIAGAVMQIQADKVGYDAWLKIPCAAVRIVRGQPFLLDLIVRVNALGDAHGRVSQVWQGSRHAHLDSSQFAVIEPV